MKNYSAKLRAFFASAVMLLSVTAFAQSKDDVPSGTMESHELKPYRNTKVYTQDLQINGATLDKRVAKYYDESSLKDMDAVKVKQLNYMYLKSFEVSDYNSLSAAAKKYIDEKFDIGGYEKYRKQTERTTVDISAEGHSFKVEMLSREEMLNERNKIK